MSSNWIYPDWPAPARVKSLVTTRGNGVSRGVYAGLNLGDHVGDDPIDVAQNRTLLREMLPSDPVWLRQVHGATVAYADHLRETVEADAAVAHRNQTVCAVLTADCLPVLFCATDGSVVAAAHAGWRGLLAGVLEQTLDVMGLPAEQVMAWMGPAIGPEDYQVGNEVRQAFVSDFAQSAAGFKGCGSGKWLADMYTLARQRLQRAGVTRIYGGGFSTYAEPVRFYSHRRDGVTGRMASLVWIDD
ncbi:MAG: peptidoglycan editing factor PgeF [Betaproteobacteria bacterium]|nr:peptidoglycan editing factor PgeF [Betaproteobacteria bacterium]